MRYLALDLGDKRIGVAVSDSLPMLARPVEVFQRTSRKDDYAHIQALMQELGAERIVAGLPYNMDGTEGKQAAWVRDYTAELTETLGIPVDLWDERLTTEDAKLILRKQGKRVTKDWLDAVAAAVILQSFIDALSHRSATFTFNEE